MQQSKAQLPGTSAIMSTSGKVALYKNLAQNANGAEVAKPRYLRSGVNVEWSIGNDAEDKRGCQGVQIIIGKLIYF